MHLNSKFNINLNKINSSNTNYESYSLQKILIKYFQFIYKKDYMERFLTFVIY